MPTAPRSVPPGRRPRTLPGVTGYGASAFCWPPSPGPRTLPPGASRQARPQPPSPTRPCDWPRRPCLRREIDEASPPRERAVSVRHFLDSTTSRRRARPCTRSVSSTTRPGPNGQGSPSSSRSLAAHPQQHGDAVVQLAGPLAMRDKEVDLGTREPAADWPACWPVHALITRGSSTTAPGGDGGGVDRPSQPALRCRPPCQAWPPLTPATAMGRAAGRSIAYVATATTCANRSSLPPVGGHGLRVAFPAVYDPLSTCPCSRLRRSGQRRRAVYTDVGASRARRTKRWRGGKPSRLHNRRRLMQHAAPMPSSSTASRAPAARVSAEVVDCPHSVVWQQAENRMHSARGLFLFLLGVRQ